MKKLLPIFLCCLSSVSVFAQIQMWSQGIQSSNVDVKGAPVVLSQIDISVDEPGSVLITFEGNCIATVGDRIILAANNAPDWVPNGGSVAMEAIDTDLNRMPFAHSRIFEIAAGNHSFYAVAENWVEQDGNGIASIYGSFTVTFYPATGLGGQVMGEAVQLTNFDLNDGPETVASLDFLAPADGQVILRFNGYFVGDVGDRIILAASDSPSWGVNDGNVGLEPISSDINRRNFSHTRTYNVSAGNYTFYGVADNHVETEGSGIASIYGQLSLEYYPLTGTEVVTQSQNISASSVDVEGAPVVLAETSLTVPKEGKVLVRFDGSVTPSVGDRIVLAASDIADWGVNDGNIGVEIPNSDQNHVSFAHSRMYEVAPGTYPFYAVAENWVEQDGNGLASFYGTLTSTYVPNEWDAINSVEEIDLIVEQFKVQPNPVQSQTLVKFPKPSEITSQLLLVDVDGQIVGSWEVAKGTSNFPLDIADLPRGNYWLQWIRGEVVQTHTLIKM